MKSYFGNSFTIPRIISNPPKPESKIPIDFFLFIILSARLYTLYFILYTGYMVNLDTALRDIPRITPKYAKILEKMRLVTVRDFLLYFPFRYDDFSQTVPLSENYLDQAITVEGKIIKAKNFRARAKRMSVTEITIEDENATPLKATWFNQPYILESLPQGSSIRLSGKLTLDGKYFQMIGPAWEKSSRDATNTGRLVPVYSETVGITSKWIRWQMKTLLPLARQMEDILPEDIRKKYHLPNIY